MTRKLYTTAVTIDIDSTPIKWIQHPEAKWHEQPADAEREMRRLMDAENGRNYWEAFRVVDQDGNRIV